MKNCTETDRPVALIKMVGIENNKEMQNQGNTIDNNYDDRLNGLIEYLTEFGHVQTSHNLENKQRFINIKL